LETTARYAHVSTGLISAVESPLDRLSERALRLALAASSGNATRSRCPNIYKLRWVRVNADSAEGTFAN